MFDWSPGKHPAMSSVVGRCCEVDADSQPVARHFAPTDFSSTTRSLERELNGNIRQSPRQAAQSAPMLKAYIKHGDGSVSTDSSEASLARALKDPKAVFWVDMDAPTDDELAVLDDVFGFHPLAIEDTISYQQRPKIESYNHIGDVLSAGYFYMVIHGPDLQQFKENVRTKELDIFVSERYLVTIHEEHMFSIENVMKRCSADPRRLLEQGIDMLLHGILDQIVDHYQPILDHLNESLEDLEDQAISSPDPKLLSVISKEKRDLLNLRRIIGPQREVIAQLSRGDVPFIRESSRVYFRDVQDHLFRALEMLELQRELVVSARDLYLSSVNNSLNNVMKTLTLITVVALPINMITGFYGMNFDYLPGRHNQFWFWLMLAMMLALVAGMIYVARRWRWL
jgi:magnesium transporter